MKKFITIIALLCGQLVFAHGDSRVEIELESSQVLEAGQNEFKFQLIDEDLNKVVKDADLKISHEKKLHMMIYDLGLKEYFHVHPEFIDDSWSVKVDIPKNGKYLFWVQGVLAIDGDEFSSKIDFQVVNGSTENSTPPILGDSRSGSNSGSKVEISGERLRAKKEVMPIISFSRLDGSAPDITPYLGALAHVVIVSNDGQTIIHAHPMSHGNPHELMLHTNFPKEGDYRVWVEFIDGGNLKSIPLSVSVYK